ncbi:MAG: hypothetical protein AB4372_35880 [Xenococcus sp. (in: cyanobacteria)]
MAKKTFRGGIDSVLGESNVEKATTQTKRKPDAPQPGEKRATFHINEELLEKIKAIAYWDRLTIKEIVNDAFAKYVESYEKKNGVIESIPKK